jgi:hypothetical protein
MAIPVFRSAAFEGTVFHRRLRPKPHAFRYRVFSLLIDLDELPALDHGLRLFSHNRWNLFSFLGIGAPCGLKAWALDQVGALGLPVPDGKVELLCYPRLLGYVFNPLSVYFCRNRGGAIAAILYEVNNTFGERHTYVLPAADRNDVLRHQSRKALYVSPFNGAGGDYAFTTVYRADRLSIRIDQSDDAGPTLVAGFTGRRSNLSDTALLGLALHYPLMTLKVIAAIHWQALRLLLKGVPLRPRPRHHGAGHRPDAAAISRDHQA